jgi:hypothetical protein
MERACWKLDNLFAKKLSLQNKQNILWWCIIPAKLNGTGTVRREKNVWKEELHFWYKQHIFSTKCFRDLHHNKSQVKFFIKMFIFVLYEKESKQYVLLALRHDQHILDFLNK